MRAYFVLAAVLSLVPDAHGFRAIRGSNEQLLASKTVKAFAPEHLAESRFTMPATKHTPWRFYWYFDDEDSPHLYWICYGGVPVEGRDELWIRFENGTSMFVRADQLVRDYKFFEAGRDLWEERDKEWRVVVATGEREGLNVEVEIEGGDRELVHVDKLTPTVRDFRVSNPEFYSISDREFRGKGKKPDNFRPTKHYVPNAFHPDAIYDGSWRNSRLGNYKPRGVRRIAKYVLEHSLAHLGADAYEESGERERKRLRNAKVPEFMPMCKSCDSYKATSKCCCGGKGTGSSLLSNLARSALSRVRNVDLADGWVSSDQCEYLTGVSSPAYMNELLGAATGMPADELAAALAMTHHPSFAGGKECKKVENDHTWPIARRLPGKRRPCLDRLPKEFILKETPGWEDGKPNDALRRLSRAELIQWMFHEENARKGALMTQTILDDSLVFEECFYSHEQLKEPDVLKRTYRRETEILKKVTAWGKKRYATFNRWYPIGGLADPSS